MHYLSQMIRFLVFSQVIFATPPPSAPIQMHEKPSLKALVQDSKKAKDLTLVLEKLKKYVADSEAFVRAEIDDENVYKGLLEFQRNTLKNDALLLTQKKYPQVKEDLSVWINFAADLSYEEASYKGLKLCNELRLAIFDFIDGYVALKLPEIMKQDELWLPWSLNIRIPWPADRVIMTEATRLKSPKAQFTARQIVASLQRNPYQTCAEALTKAQGPKTLELKELEKFWTAKELTQMKTEVNRLSRIQIRFALALYQNRFGTPAKSLDVLVQNKLLPQVPLDYLTSKRFTLAQVK